MNTRVSARDISLLLTTTSILLAFAAIQLGHRLNYLEHLPMFNAMAAGMLALVVAGLVFAAVTLVRARGMGGSLWFAASLATVVLGMLLLVD